MNKLLFSKQFEKSFSRLRNKTVKKQIWQKILQLENRAPIGKKLKNNPFWSVHVNQYRIIYLMEGSIITVLDILERRHSYREL